MLEVSSHLEQWPGRCSKVMSTMSLQIDSVVFCFYLLSVNVVRR